MKDAFLQSLVDRLEEDKAYIVVTHDELSKINVCGWRQQLNQMLCAKAERLVYVLCKFQASIEFMHITFKENYESIKQLGLKMDYAYPEEGQSSVGGIYAYLKNLDEPLKDMDVTLRDMFEEDGDFRNALLCEGRYEGDYYLVVNAPQYRYLILQADAKVDKFYEIVNYELAEYTG